MTTPTKEALLRGIVTVGISQEDATNNFRLAALGKNVQVLTDKVNAFVSNSSDNSLFNPNTGEIDLISLNNAASSIDFSSYSGSEIVEAHHHLCTSCSSHTIYEDKDYVKFCPVCATGLSTSSDDEFDYTDVPATAAKTEDEDEDATDNKDHLTLDDDEDEDDEPLVIASGSHTEAVQEFIRQRNNGVSLSSGNLTANYVVCSDTDCGSHILSESHVAVANCPNCSAPTIEPTETTAVSTAEVSGKRGNPSTTVTIAIEPDEDVQSMSSDIDDDTAYYSDLDIALASAGSNEPDEPDPTMEVSVSSLSKVVEDKDAANLDVLLLSVSGSPKWMAFYKGEPVASLSRTEANADMFDKSIYGTVVKQAASSEGIVFTLNTMGFQPFSQSVSVSTVARDLADKDVLSAKAEMADMQGRYQEHMLACLATAAVGINKGFFSKTSNPLKTQLMSALATAGVNGAEQLIDAAFSTSADAYHKTLFDKAVELAEMPLEVRNHMAEAVTSTNYMATASSLTPFEAHLANFGTPTIVETPNVSQVSTSSTETFSARAKRAVDSL